MTLEFFDIILKLLTTFICIKSKEKQMNLKCPEMNRDNKYKHT